MAQTIEAKREKRRASNRARRELFVALTEEMNTNLCTVCKYSDRVWGGCCEGYNYCAHPSESICEMHDEGLEPGDYCWAFKSAYPLDTIVELTSAVILSGFTEWSFRIYNKTELTLYGFTGVPRDKKKSGKIRIGHNGKPEQKEGVTHDI